jgi:regulator of sigma E protease
VITVIIFIIILGILIFVHELGHYLVAKKNDVKVEEFGFGFPPRIWGIKKGETVYSINLIPLGGFVKIFGEEGEGRQDYRSFASKKIWRRAAILVAGVSMNIMLAIFLVSLGYAIGLPTAVDDSQNFANAKVQITDVAIGSPASAAGIKAGDTIVALSGPSGEIGNIQKVATMQDFTDVNKGKNIFVDLKRGKDVITVEITPRANPPANEGPLGVGLARVTTVSFSWYRAIYEGIVTVLDITWATILALGYLLWQLISQGKVAGDVTGPVGIYSLTSQAAQMGFVYLLQLTVLLSVNLAIINVLPLPALDGGRLLFLLIEKIKGSPVKQTVERAVHTAGFVFLLALMLLITIRDLLRIF